MDDVKAGTVLTPRRREESVLVKTDASGVVQKVTSEITLSEISGEGTGALFVRDSCGLTDIRNSEGDEDWVTDGPDVYWEYRGKDIRYEGKALEEVPFGVSVTYYLNGEEIDPAKLAGANGTVRIRFDYSNRTGAGPSLIPAAAMTVIFLPE